MRRYSDYDPFAWLYANAWGEPFHRAVQAPLERVFYPHLPARAKVLDLCCGDGRLAAVLAQRGYSVTGIDGSEEMLSYARERCPKARFLLADARDFELPPTFHAVLSTFDSLNHVMTTAHLARVFQRVWDCLRPGGIFLFDLNREEAYVNSWIKTGANVTENLVNVSRGVYYPETRLAICDITVLRERHGVWSRSDFELRQKFHPHKTVLAKLQAAGFEAELHDASALGMKGEIGTNRDFYLARKARSSAE
jgi:SAM-dependent methyltransferase